LHPTMKSIIACLALLAGCAPGRVPPPVLDQYPVATGELAAIRDGFVARVESQGFELPYRPMLREWTRPSLVSWRAEARSVAVPDWDKVDPKVRNMFLTCGGRRFFDLAFRWFFPVHELAHFLQSEFNWQGDHAGAERLANDLAVAFHRSRAGGAGRLDDLRAGISSCLGKFPLPAEAKPDPDGFFNSHYQKITGDPMVYGAFQWRFLLDSLDKADRLDFGDLVNRLIRQTTVPTAVMLNASLDVGFHVAAHLYLPDVAITLFDPLYTRQVKMARRQLVVPDLLIRTQRGMLSRRLNLAWHVHRLVRVPALFLDFKNTRTAFALLTGEQKPVPGNKTVRERLDKFLLPLYPELKNLSPSEEILALALTSLIEYEYESFFATFHAAYFEKWEWSRRKFRREWYREIGPAVAALGSASGIREVVIVLSPALRRHGKSYRVLGGIGRVASLLPENPDEMEHALLYAFHELCHGISDSLVLGPDARPGIVSYKQGEKGKELHLLIEAAANQTMFESLGKTNPRMQERFLARFGNLSWLTSDNRLAKHVSLAGNRIDAERLDRLIKGLRTSPLETSREIYAQGLLVSTPTLDGIRRILSR
jgi:hypothetical protein